MIEKIKTVILSFFSFVFGSLGITGFFGLCCTVAGANILAFLGLSFLSSILVVYNKWFLLVSLGFLILAIIFYFKNKDI